jgi:hypothetical protein
VLVIVALVIQEQERRVSSEVTPGFVILPCDKAKELGQKNKQDGTARVE